MIFIITGLITAFIIKKVSPNLSAPITDSQKTAVFSIATIEFLLPVLYFTGFVSFAIVPFGMPLAYLMFGFSLLIAAGFVSAIFLFMKRQMLLFAVFMLIMSVVLFGISGLALLFRTM